MAHSRYCGQRYSPFVLSDRELGRRLVVADTNALNTPDFLTGWHRSQRMLSVCRGGKQLIDQCLSVIEDISEL